MKRDDFIDTIKGLLMILVVLGHVIGSFQDCQLNVYLRNFIYLFHMPLFVFLSGYFNKIEKTKTSIISLLETYFIFQTIYIGFDFNIFSYILYPNWILWYIFSLILWKIATYALKDILDQHIKIIMIISIILSLLVGFTKLGYIFSLSRFFVFYPFFLWGYSIRKMSAINNIKDAKHGIYILIIAIIAIFLSRIDFDLTYITHGSHPYVDKNDLIYRIIFMFVAYILSCAVINLTKTNKILSYIGANSLVFYLYHGLLVRIIQYYIKTYELPTNTFFIILYTLLIVIALYALSKLKSLNKFICNPISHVVKYFRR